MNSSLHTMAHWTHLIALSGQTPYTTGFGLQISQNHALLYSSRINSHAPLSDFHSNLDT